MKTFRHFWRYLAKFILEWEMFYTKVVQKMKTHILGSVPFFHKAHRLWDIVEKRSVHPRGPQIMSQYGAYALLLDLQGYMQSCARTRPRARVPTCTHARAHRPISNTYCFSTATMIRERASMLRYAHIACLVVTAGCKNTIFVSFQGTVSAVVWRVLSKSLTKNVS
jgi:hypothetical protein